MTAANDPPITAAPQPQANDSVEPTPAAETPAAPPDFFATEARRLDRILALMVVVLAFLATSFVARNSDFWMHLASGRLLAQGQYTFGTDPFAYTSTGAYWTNHSWLYDLGLYGLTELCGGVSNLAVSGAVLVAIKAVFIAMLALVLLRIRRRDGGIWAPAVCVGLTVLALAPRAYLQPVVVSFLFEGLALWLLVKEGKPDPTETTSKLGQFFTTSPRRLYVLPVLFALWVNIDQWFLLGPVLVALYLLAETLQPVLNAPEEGSPAPVSERGPLLVTLGLGLVACLLNPHHFHVFELPPEILAAARFPGLQTDPWFKSFFYSPLNMQYFSRDVGLSVTGQAYVVLFVLGLISFGLVRANWQAWRVVIWSAFGLLSFYNIRLIPFFAIVAGPITALNLQDFAAARPVARRRVALYGRLFTLLLGIGLIVAAWPGWLQTLAENPRYNFRVGWGVEADPSLRQAAYKIDYWRAQGLLKPEDRGFNILPGSAQYFAWFCPGEQGYFDARYTLQSPVVAKYREIREALHGGFNQSTSGLRRNPPNDWQQTFRQHGINHVVLTGPSNEVAVRLMNDPQQWTLLYLDGRTTIFGWNDPEKQERNRFAALAFDARPAVFGPGEVVRAPSAGPARAPHVTPWWETFTTVPPPPSLDAEEATMLVMFYQSMGQQRLRFRFSEYSIALAAGLVGCVEPSAGLMPNGMSALGRLRMAVPLRSMFLTQNDQGPPAFPLLAVRLARRALAESPDDPGSYLAAFQSTEELWWKQENHWAKLPPWPAITPGRLHTMLSTKQSPAHLISPWWKRGMVGPRSLVRSSQALAALEHMAALVPDSPVVHQQLYEIYWGQMNYYDIGLDHLREEVRCWRIALARMPENNRKELANVVAEREKLLATNEKELTDLQRLYEMEVANQPPAIQGMLAFYRYGLANQAMRILSQEPPEKIGPEGAELEIYLALTMGRAEDLREIFKDDLKAVLGLESFSIFRAAQAAAVGDYAVANAALDELLGAIQPPKDPAVLHMLQAKTFGSLDLHVLPRLVLWPHLQRQMMEANGVLGAQQSIDELTVLRGLLALDEGDNETAIKQFKKALNPTTPHYRFESQPIAVRYLELLGVGERR